MADDVKKNTCILTKNIDLAVLIGDLILPDRSVLTQVFGEENLPRMTQEENQLLKQHSKWLSNKQNIYEAVGLSISSEEDIFVFLNKLKKNNWEGVFYTALCSMFGFKITNEIEYKNPDFFADIIKNNFHSRDNSENKIEKQTVKNTRGMLLLLYKCQIATNKCDLQPKLDKDVTNEICSYLPKYVLREWIDKNKLNWIYLCQNPNAVDMIKEELERDPNSKKINWEYLCLNTSDDVIKIIEEEYQKNPDSNKLNWSGLCRNPKAVHIIKAELKRKPNNEKINWRNLCANSKAIDILKEELKENPESKRIYWDFVSENPGAMDIIEEELLKNPNNGKINWHYLCANPSAVDIIEEIYKRNPNSERIDWLLLCENPNAVHLIEEELKRNSNNENIQWPWLFKNPNAIDIIEKNLDKLTLEFWNGFNLGLRITWTNLNMNFNAVHLIEKEYKRKFDSDNLHWSWICRNPNALRILREELIRDSTGEQIFWEKLSLNPAIFKPILDKNLYKILSQY